MQLLCTNNMFVVVALMVFMVVALVSGGKLCPENWVIGPI